MTNVLDKHQNDILYSTQNKYTTLTQGQEENEEDNRVPKTPPPPLWHRSSVAIYHPSIEKPYSDDHMEYERDMSSSVNEEQDIEKINGIRNSKSFMETHYPGSISDYEAQHVVDDHDMETMREDIANSIRKFEELSKQLEERNLTTSSVRDEDHFEEEGSRRDGSRGIDFDRDDLVFDRDVGGVVRGGASRDGDLVFDNRDRGGGSSSRSSSFRGSIRGGAGHSSHSDEDIAFDRGSGAIPLSYSLDNIASHSSDQTHPLSGEEEVRSKSDGETEELIQRERAEDEPIIVEERSKSDGEKNEEDDDDAVPLKIQAIAHNKGTKLLLSNSWLKTIPAEVWDLTHLTELDLSANYLKKVSKSIGNLSQLKKLRLNHNQLSVLPKEIWSLTRLTALLLNNNCLKAIPKDIKNLTKLKTLDLSSNQINEISVKEGLLNVTSLIELRLRNNSLPSIPLAMAEALTNLQVLWLEGNPLPIPKSIIKKPANIILAYIKDHPTVKKPGKTLEPIKPRTLRKSPPVVVPGKPGGLPHGKKDLHVIAEKELKKRKREQLEEMRKHIEVEKKVKVLEHELMLANAKALKFEEEVRKVEEQKLTLDPQQPQPQQSPQHLPQQQQSPQQHPPPYSPLPFAQLPPHVPRQHGVIVNNNNTGKILSDKSSPAHNFEWEIPFTELAFGPRIGRGGYGEVFRGMWGGTEVAIKMLFTDNMSAKLITDLRNEVELLCKLRHPNIVLFMGACTEPETPCIVTEYLGRGSLASILLDESIEVDWGLRLQIAIDCARGMAYLHSRNPVIIHRDLKTDNLLVDDNWQVKVADFGLATVKSRTFAKTMCGTTGWVAPEVLAEEGYTEKADVYSFAIILWEMLTRQIPYAGKNTMQVVRSVDRGERLTIPAYCPPDYAQLINDCWHTDPAKRLSFVEILPRMEKMRANYLLEKKQKAEALLHPPQLPPPTTTEYLLQPPEPPPMTSPMVLDDATSTTTNHHNTDNTNANTITTTHNDNNTHTHDTPTMSVNPNTTAHNDNNNPPNNDTTINLTTNTNCNTTQNNDHHHVPSSSHMLVDNVNNISNNRPDINIITTHDENDHT